MPDQYQGRGLPALLPAFRADRNVTAIRPAYVDFSALHPTKPANHAVSSHFVVPGLNQVQRDGPSSV